MPTSPSLPTIRQVVQHGVKRQKQNQIYERQLHQYLHGPKGLTWRLHYKLEQIENDERHLGRDLHTWPKIPMPKKSKNLVPIGPTDLKEKEPTDDYLSSILSNLRSSQSSSREKLAPTHRYVPPYKRLFWLDYYQHQQLLNKTKEH